VADVIGINDGSTTLNVKDDGKIIQSGLIIKP